MDPCATPFVALRPVPSPYYFVHQGTFEVQISFQQVLCTFVQFQSQLGSEIHVPRYPSFRLLPSDRLFIGVMANGPQPSVTTRGHGLEGEPA
jgi:hypothetical protein